MIKKRLLSMLVLLVTAATGAWAVSAVASIGETEYTTLQAAFTAAETGQTIKLLSDVTQAGGVGKSDGKAVTFDLNGHIYTCTDDNYVVVATNNSQITIIDSSTGTPGGIKSQLALVSQDNGKIIIKAGRYNIGNMSAEDLLQYFPYWGGVEMYSGYTLQNITPADAQGFCVGVVAPTYTVALKSGTEDAANWQGKAGTGDYQALPLEGVAAGTAVSVKYSGTKMVKSVKARKKAAGPEVTTFSELQAALSAGKDVKLMNDIVCTAEIEITSNGALTIDGNGKKLSTTSAIRAFAVKSSATVAFKNLTLTGFVSGGGPAINNNGGTIVLDGCTISNCHVSNSGQGGGAIENKSNGKLYAINTTFSGNYSGEIGGAINNYGGSLYMSGCTFTDNYTTMSSAYWGGAIGINGGSEVRLINCSFSGNKYGTTAGTNDIGVYNNPTNYTIAGCTGATIASRVAGDITTNASGTATLDYSDLSNITFTYKLPVTVTWNSPNFSSSTSQDGVTLTTTDDAAVGNNFYNNGANTFTTTLGKFTKIEIVCTSGDIDGWTKETAGKYQPHPDIDPDKWKDLYKLTWTGDAESVTIQEGVYGIQSITFNIQ